MDGNPFGLICLAAPLLLGTLVYALLAKLEKRRLAWSCFGGATLFAAITSYFLWTIYRDEELYGAVIEKDVPRVRHWLSLGANPDYVFEDKTARQEVWNMHEDLGMKKLIPEHR